MKINSKKGIEILLFSLKEGLKWKFWKYLSTIGIGTLLGAIQFGESVFQWDSKRSLFFAFSLIFATYIIKVIIIFFVQLSKYFHETYFNSKYGEAILTLKDIFSQFHSYRKDPGHQDEQFMRSMIFMCNNLKAIYDNITNSECSVSIKVPLLDCKVDERTILVNLTRDTEHSKSDTALNRDTEKYKKTLHTIIGNTAFSNSLNKVIKKKQSVHYLNNNINETDNYDNTSKDCYENGFLPYNSELVHPIVPSVTIDPRNYDCHGFICIDSVIKNAFKNKYDIGLLEGVADGIYDIISERNKVKNNTNE